METRTLQRAPGSTISEKLGASAGMWAVLWLVIHYLILQRTSADPKAGDGEFVRLLLAERMSWEWATALRVMGGVMIIWFMGSLASRLRLAEGEPGRLASISFGVGVVWGAIWLVSAMFNSASILLAADYQYPAASRLAAILGRESVMILTPALVFTLALAVGFVGMRFGGFPKAYIYLTATLSVVFLALAIADWYGPGNLAGLIMMIAFAWTAATSALLVPTYHPPDIVRGTR